MMGLLSTCRSLRSLPLTLDALVREIEGCQECRIHPLGAPLPHAPRPVVRLSTSARLLVAGQAPGARVHASGKPYDDPSGTRLRRWMNITAEVFYDRSQVAILPMGFCFPGYDEKGADRPPRRECRHKWHGPVMSLLPAIETILAIGHYAQAFHLDRLGLGDLARGGLTATVARWAIIATRAPPRIIPLPHPSWRNNGWLRKNTWFETEIVPEIRKEVARLTKSPG
jgi:uracil-DNA glycosylase